MQNTVAMARSKREEQFFPEAVIAVPGTSDHPGVEDSKKFLSSSSLSLRFGVGSCIFIFFFFRMKVRC